MKINEVEAAVGVTKKNIRFYEEELYLVLNLIEIGMLFLDILKQQESSF